MCFYLYINIIFIIYNDLMYFKWFVNFKYQKAFLKNYIGV